GTNSWYVECEITWIKGTIGFYVADGTNLSTDRLFCVALGKQGDTVSAEVQIYNGTTYSMENQMFVATGTTHTYRIEKVTASPDQYSIYVDGVLKHSGAPAWMQQDANVSKVQFATAYPYNNEECYIDNVDCSWTFVPQSQIMIDEDFESYNTGEILTDHSNWHLNDYLVPYGATLVPVATNYNGSIQAHVVDTSSSLQNWVWMDAPPGSGMVDWWVECEITWIRGSVGFSVEDGLSHPGDLLYSFSIGWPSDTVNGEVLRYDGTLHSLTVPVFVATGSTHTFRVVKTASATDTYSLYMDGVPIEANSPGVYQQDAADVACVVVATGVPYNNDEAYVDNIDCSWTYESRIDIVPPSISLFSSPGDEIQQGSIASISWSINETHPAIYNILLDGACVINATYSDGDLISIPVNTTVAGTKNYTLVAWDQAGNRAQHAVVTTVVVQLTPFTMIFDFLDPNGLWLNLTVLEDIEVDFLPVAITPDDQGLSSLPDGYLPAKPFYFDITVDDDQVTAGIGRIYYGQSALASQVYENSLTVLFWDVSNGTWIGCNARLNKELNFVEFDFDVSGRYLLAGQPKHNYDILIIIIVIVGSVAAVSGVVYQQRKKVTTSTGGFSLRGKKMTANRYDVPTGNDVLERKRARLMTTRYPESPGRDAAETTNESFPHLKKVYKPEENIDIPARAARAREMMREVTIHDQNPACIVHKGPVSGLNYKCQACGAVYCLDCAKHLVANHEACWNCGSGISFDEESLSTRQETINSNLIPETTLSMFSKNIWLRMLELERTGALEKSIFDEVLARLKEMPPDARLPFLNSGLFLEDKTEVQDDDEESDDESVQDQDAGFE
nr:hypothetical protein [Candidatus Sigynarchaeota archaeon]